MRRRARAVAGWVTDWRNGATLAATLVAIAVVLFVVDASHGRSDAVRALQAQTAQAIDAREAASRRIDLLSQQVELLTGEVINLREMLLAAGVDPPPRPTTTTTASPSRRTTTTTVRRAPSATTTTQRPGSTTTAPPATTTSQPPTTSTTSTTRPCAVSIPGVCV